jgi:glycosyltransferase 2 family protein
MTTTAVSQRSPSRLSAVFAGAVSIVALAAVVWWALRQPAPRFPSEAADLALIGVAVLVYAFATLVRGWRWHVVMRNAALPHERADALALVPVGYMGNTVLPARGGEVLRILLLGDRTTARKREILGSVVSERVLDAASLALLFVALSVAGVAGNPMGIAAPVATAGALAALAVALAVYLRLRRAGRMQRLADMLRPVTRASRALIGRTGALLLAVTAGIWMLEALIFFLVGESLALDITLLEAAFVLVLTSYFSLIPAAPGYVGTFEAAVLFGLDALGVGGGTAVTFALLVRFVLFVPITVVGLVLLIVRYGGLRQLRRRDVVDER